MPAPSGTERVRPFLPTRDFDASKRFYEALGFEKVLDSEVAIFNTGSGGFILQRLYSEAWAEMCMMQLMVDDLDAWWAHIEKRTSRSSMSPHPASLQVGIARRLRHRSKRRSLAYRRAPSWRAPRLSRTFLRVAELNLRVLVLHVANLPRAFAEINRRVIDVFGHLRG